MSLDGLSFFAAADSSGSRLAPFFFDFFALYALCFFDSSWSSELSPLMIASLSCAAYFSFVLSLVFLCSIVSYLIFCYDLRALARLMDSMRSWARSFSSRRLILAFTCFLDFIDMFDCAAYCLSTWR